MDSNGRQRTTSSPSVSLPSSSTFRRLPALGKTPFRRDKASTPPNVHSASASTSVPAPAFASLESSHQRVSTFPSLAKIAAEETNAFSPTATAGAGPSTEQLDGPNTTHHNQLFPPSRSSSLPQGESDSLPALSPLPSGAGAGVGASTPNSLEPITYPSHLAQTRPPDAEQSTSRPREFTLGAGSTILLGSAVQPADTKPRDSGQREGQGLRSRAAEMNRASSTESPGDPVRRRRATTTTKTMTKEDIVRSRKTSSKNRDIRALTAELPNNKAVTKRAPASAMYFSALPSHGRAPEQPLRAHTGTLVGDRIWFIGGVDGKNCWRRIAWFDTETLFWSTVDTFGEQLPPLRAHTTTLVGHNLFIFGGGDGPTYSNDIWILNTITHRFSRPVVTNPKNELPPPRRAHTTVQFHQFLVVFGGGNGQAALNDVWALDVSDPERVTWHEWVTTGDVPQKKGYHTANLVGEKLIIFGGSDGHASFADVHILNLQTLIWTLVNTEIKHNRLSHTSTQVGSYLFVIGGHNGQSYAQEVLLFNLVTLQWETKTPRGSPPPGRGYHVAVLHDARVYISGGYNGVNVFDDLWALDLSAGAYLPQVTTFEVDETVG